MKKSTLQLFLIGFVFFVHNAIGQKIISKAEYFLTDESGKKISPVFSSLDDFNDSGIAIFSISGKRTPVNGPWGNYNTLNGGKYGLINDKGKIIVDGIYDKIEELNYSNDSMFVVTMDNKKGLMNHRGRMIMPIEFKELSYTYNDYSVIRIKTMENLYRLFSMNGSPLTGYYDYLDVRENGTKITERGNEGWLDKNYKVAIPAVYKKLDYIKSSNKFIAQDKYFKYYIINDKNEKLPGIKYDEIRKIYNSDDYDIVIGYEIKKKGKYGFMNSDFEVVIAPQFDDISDIQIKCGSLYLACEKSNHEILLYNSSGTQVSKNKYNYIRTSAVMDKYLLVTPYSKKLAKNYYGSTQVYTLIDLQGKQVLPVEFTRYDVAYSYRGKNKDLLLMKTKTGWSAYNKNLEQVIGPNLVAPEKLTYISSLGDGYYMVQIGGEDSRYGKPDGGVFGVVDESGKKILPLEYEDISYNSYDGYFTIKKAGKYGLLDKEGAVLFNAEYSEIDCSGDFCIVKKYFENDHTDKYGIINIKQKKELIEPKYEYLKRESYDSKNKYIFRQNSKFGVLTAEGGKILIEAKYNYLKSSDVYYADYLMVNNFGSVEAQGNDWDGWGGNAGYKVKGGVWGVINSKGDTIVPIKFKSIEFVQDTFVNAVDEDNRAYIYKLKGMKKVTPDGANFLEVASYNYKYENTPNYFITFIMGKDVQEDEYGSKKGGTYGLTNSNGQILADFKYSEIKTEGSNYICALKDLKGFDLLNKDGKVLISEATSIVNLNDSLFLVQKGEEAFVYSAESNTRNNLGNATSYNAPEYSYGSGLFGIKNKDNKWGAINTQGEWVIEPAYCDLLGASNGANEIIAAKCDGALLKYGVMDAEQNIIIPFEYESIETSYTADYACLKNNVIYYIDKNNKVVKSEKASDSKLRNLD